jgi:hypothetical protein
MRIKLKYCKSLKDDLGRNLLGFTYKNGKKILIRKGLSKEILFETLVHEFTHLALILSKTKLSREKHERLAYGIGALATKALRDLK